MSRRQARSILELVAALDSYIPQPERALDQPYLMPIEDVFTISGRGTVVTGRIEQRSGAHGRRDRDRRDPRHAEEGSDGR